MHNKWPWLHLWVTSCFFAKPTVGVEPHWSPLSTHCINRESFYQVELLIKSIYVCEWHKKTWKCIDETYNNLHKMFFSPNQQLRSNLVDRHRRHMAAAGSNRESLYQLHLSDLRGKVMGYTINFCNSELKLSSFPLSCDRARGERG